MPSLNSASTGHKGCILSSSPDRDLFAPEPAETPCCTKSGGYLPLANFHTISYGQDYTNDMGTNYATSAAPHGLTAPINSFFSIGPATWWASTRVNENYAIPDGGVNPPPPPRRMSWLRRLASPLTVRAFRSPGRAPGHECAHAPGSPRAGGSDSGQGSVANLGIPV